MQEQPSLSLSAYKEGGYMYNMQKRRTTSSIGWSHTFPLPLETVSYESAIICLIQSITINVVCIKKHHTCHFLPSAVMAWHYLVIKYCSTKNFANYSIHFFFWKQQFAEAPDTAMTAPCIYCAMLSVALCIIFLALQKLVPRSELCMQPAYLLKESVALTENTQSH